MLGASIMTEKTIKVYVDTNILSGLAKRDFSDQIVIDFLKVLNLRKAGKLELYVSEITSTEINGIPQEFRYYHELIYKLLDNVAMKPKVHNTLITKGLGAGASSLITQGMIGTTDQLIENLEGIIPEKSSEKEKEARYQDINHLFQCKKNNLDVFWTEDVGTILTHASELENLGIKVLRSQDLIALCNS